MTHAFKNSPMHWLEISIISNYIRIYNYCRITTKMYTERTVYIQKCIQPTIISVYPHSWIVIKTQHCFHAGSLFTLIWCLHILACEDNIQFRFLVSTILTFWIHNSLLWNILQFALHVLTFHKKVVYKKAGLEMTDFSIFQAFFFFFFFFFDFPIQLTFSPDLQT